MKLNLYNIFESMNARKKFLNNTDKAKGPKNIMDNAFKEAKLGFYLSENYNNGKIIDFPALGKLIYDPEIRNLPEEEAVSKQTELLEIFNNFLIKNKLINPENDNIGYNQNRIFCSHEGWNWRITYPEHNSFLLDNNHDPIQFFITRFPWILKTQKIFDLRFRIMFPIDRTQDVIGRLLEFGLQIPDKAELFQPSTLIDIFNFIIKINQFIKSSQFAYLIKFSNSLNNVKFETKCTDITKHEYFNISWNFNKWDSNNTYYKLKYDTYFSRFIITFYFLTVFQQQKKYLVVNSPFSYLSLQALIKRSSHEAFSLSNFNEVNPEKLWKLLISVTQAKTMNLFKNKDGIKNITDFCDSIFYENNLLPFDSNKVITNPPSIMKTLNKFFGPTKIID